MAEDPHPERKRKMSKVAVVYWSGTGNTAKMADAVAEGAKGAGAEAEVIECSSFSSANVSEYDTIAFGCPAMGAEVLEEAEFDPMFTELEGTLQGKKIGLFGSWGWGGGAWMTDWEERCKNDGAVLLMPGVMCQDTPDDAALEECRALGAALA